MHSTKQILSALRAIAAEIEPEPLRNRIEPFVGSPLPLNSIFVELEAMSPAAKWQQLIANLKRNVADLGTSMTDSAIALAILSAIPVTNDGTVELVWTIPRSVDIANHETLEVLEELIWLAQDDLIIVSYAVVADERLRHSIDAARARGVRIRMVFDYTFGKAYQRIDLKAMKRLVSDPSGVEWYEWLNESRPRHSNNTYGALHAKLALADESRLLITSANLTQAAVKTNIELGVLFDRGPKPSEVRRHLEHLFNSTFTRFYP